MHECVGAFSLNSSYVFYHPSTALGIRLLIGNVYTFIWNFRLLTGLFSRF